MAKSNRRYSSGTGPGRPESPRRTFRSTDDSPPQRPPAGATGARPVGSPRPLTPVKAQDRPGWLAAFGPQRLVVAFTGLVIVAAIGLLLFAYWNDRIRPPNQEAVRVGDRSYNLAYWARRYKQVVEDPVNAESVRTGLLTTLPERTSTDIANDAAYLQRADRLGISATGTEIDREMLTANGIPVVLETPEGQEAGPDDPIRVTPGLENAIRAQLQKYGYTLEQFREIYHAAVLRNKVESQFREKVPTSGPQARLRLLQFPNESDARIAIDRIRSGQSTFTDLAESVSLDSIGKGRGGERDWLPRGILPPTAEEFAFTAPINTLSEPIDTGLENGWVLIEVLERSDSREIVDLARRQLVQKRVQDWLTAQKDELGVRTNVSQDDIEWAYIFADVTPPTTSPQRPAGLPTGPGGLPTLPITPPAAPGAAPAAPPPAAPPASSP